MPTDNSLRFRFPVIQDFEIGKRYEKEDCKEQEKRSFVTNGESLIIDNSSNVTSGQFPLNARIRPDMS